MEDACATVYTANYTDPRIRELSSIDLNISPQGKELFQRLAPKTANQVKTSPAYALTRTLVRLRSDSSSTDTMFANTTRAHLVGDMLFSC